MNFIITFKKGQEGHSKGLSMGEGLIEIDRAINGVQRGMIYGMAAAPKAGKSTMADYGFIIEPYLDSIKTGVDFRVIYNSYEIDRVNKEFDFASHFLDRDHDISNVDLPDGVFKDKCSNIPMSSGYLMGRMQDDEGELIKVSDEIKEKLKIVYLERIIPLFGEYNDNGEQTKKGIIHFLSNRDNPTGIRNEIIEYAEKIGTFSYHHFKNKEGIPLKRTVGYKPNNPQIFVMVVTDHLRKVMLERGFNLKQTVDKTIEYSVELRNWCNFSFLHIIHLNRSMTDITRLKYAADLLYPNSDDIKDSGNLAEEADFMFTMFNPNDERYGLTKHFGEKIKDSHGNEIYPNMRTLHLVENRHGDYPKHFRLDMFGNVKRFEKLKLK
jgi:hypothetical protein